MLSTCSMKQHLKELEEQKLQKRISRKQCENQGGPVMGDYCHLSQGANLSGANLTNGRDAHAGERQWGEGGTPHSRSQSGHFHSPAGAHRGGASAPSCPPAHHLSGERGLSRGAPALSEDAHAPPCTRYMLPLGPVHREKTGPGQM